MGELRYVGFSNKYQTAKCLLPKSGATVIDFYTRRRFKAGTPQLKLVNNTAARTLIDDALAAYGMLLLNTPAEEVHIKKSAQQPLGAVVYEDIANSEECFERTFFARRPQPCGESLHTRAATLATDITRLLRIDAITPATQKARQLKALLQPLV